MECLFCNTVLTHKILDLGHSPLANDYLTEEALLLPETNYPLKVYVCHSCFLVQLYGRANPKNIFNKHYAYISSSSQTWLQHCKDYADKITSLLPSSTNNLVVEIGSNDGVLLREFIKKGLPVLGIDPAVTATSIAEKNGVPVLSEFFTKELAVDLKSKGQKAALLIGNNVLAHVPNINDFVGGLATLLHDDGICTLEFPYLSELLSRSEFDTVYHEHFFYFSLTALHSIFNHHGLEIFNIDKINIHGGSLRVYLQLKAFNNKEINAIVKDMLDAELQAGIKSMNYYLGLQEKAFSIKKNFISWLAEKTQAGKKIVAYGAAAKGNTFLNYCGIKSDLIEFVADVTVQKQGKFLPGSHIPIVAEEKIKELQPDYIIVLPWNFKEEINNRLQYVKAWGGQLAYFIPFFEIV